MDQKHQDQKEQIWDLLRAIQKKMREHLDQTYKKHGISVQEALLIRELTYYPYMTLGELSRRLGASKSTVSSMVARMEEQGIVLREVPENNRRTICLSISPMYSQRPEVMALRNELIEGLIPSGEGDELSKIIEGLHRLDELMI